MNRPGQIVAIIGGAVAGSVAAELLASREITVAVFEQNTRPYGKIEDGLPKWHVKLQRQEEQKIDTRLAHPNIHFLPNTKIGSDIPFTELFQKWGFSAILLANGAWRDRPLPIPGVDEYIGKGLVYQNPLIRWFNHCHEPDYSGESYDIPDQAIIVGGGLASIDVAKVVMLETVRRALAGFGITIDVVSLEHQTIARVLEENNLTLSALGLKGCTLFYRRRISDMPLTVVPDDAAPEIVARHEETRKKIVQNLTSRYLFRLCELMSPVGIVRRGDRLLGLRFRPTKMVDGKLQILRSPERTVLAPMVISSIGSLPEHISGIDKNGDVYDLADPASGQLRQDSRIFALGNVVTGRGNIRASRDHSKSVASFVALRFCTSEADYEKLAEDIQESATQQVSHIVDRIEGLPRLSKSEVAALEKRIRQRQEAVGYAGNYERWIESNRRSKITEL